MYKLKKDDNMIPVKYAKGDIVTRSGRLIDILEYKSTSIRGIVYDEGEISVEAEWDLDGRTLFLDCDSKFFELTDLPYYDLQINLNNYVNFYYRNDGEIVLEATAYNSSDEATRASDHYMSHNTSLVKYIGSSKMKVFPKFYEG